MPVSDLFEVNQANPIQYTTYEGPFSMANLLAGGCPGGPVPATAPGVVSGSVVETPYWSALDGNGISIGFAPGWVVIDLEHAGIQGIQWYAESPISVPSMPAASPLG